jgi:hypothetical protein
MDLRTRYELRRSGTLAVSTLRAFAAEKTFPSMDHAPVIVSMYYRAFREFKTRPSYLRKILVHGARAVVLRCKRDRIAMGSWLTSLETRAPRNVLIIAMAHKLARIAWAVLSTGQDYRALPDTVPA